MVWFVPNSAQTVTQRPYGISSPHLPASVNLWPFLTVMTPVLQQNHSQVDYRTFLRISKLIWHFLSKSLVLKV